MNKKITISILLISFGVISRLFLVKFIGIPNLEIITALALLGVIYFDGAICAFLVPLAVMFFSDLILGNNFIFLFTWSAFLLIGLIGFLYKRYSLKLKSPKFKDGAILAIAASLFFYFYTNFGWWLMSGMYSKDFSGLMKCFYMGLPFLRNNLMGNLVFVGAGVVAMEWAIKINKKQKFANLNLRNETNS